ncbi:MAG TPA: methyltransferase domain-containing protein [Anaerolineae bacterium]|nr:methyltransferase domain-containing protein [Anaerolineae bacterium]
MDTLKKKARLDSPSMNITTLFWDRNAKTYEQQEARYPQMHARNIENARKYLCANDLVLDFGCATGVKALELADDVREIQGIDISPKMVAAAKRNAVEWKVHNVDFVQATIFDQRFAEGAFDVLLAFGILHLLKDLPQALQRINILLKPGGWLISSSACMGQDDTILGWINRLLSIPARIGLLPTLQFLKIPELEAAIARAGFAIVETETIPFNPADGEQYVVGRFIAAQKEQSSL